MSDKYKAPKLTPYEYLTFKKLDDCFSMKEGTCKYGCKKGCGQVKFVRTSSGAGTYKMFRTPGCMED